MTRFQTGLVAAIIGAGVIGYVRQLETQATLRGETEALREQLRQLAALKRQNLELTRAAAEAEELKGEGAALKPLREEAAALQAQIQKQAAAMTLPVDTSGDIYDLMKLDRRPAPKRQVRPEYPAELRESGIRGDVTLGFVADAEGNVSGVTVLKSSHPAFEAAAVAAIAQWAFDAGEKAGKRVNVRMQMPIVFTQRPGSQPAAPPAGTVPPKKERVPVTGWF